MKIKCPHCGAVHNWDYAERQYKPDDEGRVRLQALDADCGIAIYVTKKGNVHEDAPSQ